MNVGNTDNISKIKDLNNFLLNFDYDVEKSDISKFYDVVIKAVPEWKRLINCKQHVTHDFTLDIHTFLVIKKIKETNSYKKLQNYEKLILLYAALFHDIEKKEGQVDNEHPQKGAKKAQDILIRLGFDQQFIMYVKDIILNHQILGRIACKKMVFDDVDLKNRIKTKDLLKFLAIFSVADIKSVKRNECFYNENIGIEIEEIVRKINNILD